MIIAVEIHVFGFAALMICVMLLIGAGYWIYHLVGFVIEALKMFSGFLKPKKKKENEKG